MKIHYSGMDWEVDLKAKTDREESWGNINYRKNLIRIFSEDNSEDNKRTTLIHECIHMILECAGIDEHKEEVVDSIAYGFFALIKDNPELKKYLFE